MKVTVTDHDGKAHEIEATEGWSLMESIQDADLPIAAECGGACACATCHVYVDASWLAKLPPKSEDETYMLDDSPDADERSRLSCQIRVTPDIDGLSVTLAPTSKP